MENIINFRIPTIEIYKKEDLCEFLEENTPVYICEHIEEKLNPVGLQWNYILTAYIQNKLFGAVVIKYSESLFNQPDFTQRPIISGLEHVIKDKNIIFKGKISP
ncbi:MAG: hypothetical protein WCK67_06055 [bacterium]